MKPPQTIETGEFAGWQCWNTDNFERLCGPFAFRLDEDGEVRCAMRLDARHLNTDGAVHGGVLMAFADFCLFAVAADALGPRGAVTASMNSDFVGPAFEGDLLEGEGEVVRAGRSLVFVSVRLKVGDRMVLSVQGVLKTRPEPQA